ncbi:MAG: hypothetical protein ABSE44_08015 [Candidatus Sulfotelmatobacter sp.]
MNLIRMDSWRALLPHSLKEPGEITSAFARAGVYDYRAAARYVSHLAYGRNNESSNAMVVLSEQRGTCSTKHALLRRLAFEQQLPFKLMLGIFEMSGKNTPRVGAVLEKYRLQSLPEAHCYLRANGHRIDATRDFDGELVAVTLDFLHEQDISAEQIGSYKTSVHQQFLSRWLAQSGAGRGRSLDEIWKIREECICALSIAAVVP